MHLVIHLSSADMATQPYWAAPVCFLWSTFNQKAYMVPVPVESGRYRRIVPSELNVDSWVLMGTELEGEGILLPVETFRTIKIGSDVLRGASFLLHYMPQTGDYARNRGAGNASKGSLPGVLGNILVVKLDKSGSAMDLPEGDMSLVQHLVLR